MSEYFLLFVSPEAPSFALRVALGGTCVCAIALLVDRLLRRRSEPLRYGILFAGIVGLLAIPALVGIGGSVPAQVLWPEAPPEDEIVRVPVELLPQILNAPNAEEAPTEVEIPTVAAHLYLGSALAVLWVLGAAFGLCRLLWALRKQSRAMIGQPWHAEFWTDELQGQLAAKLGLRKFPAVWVSPAAPMPMVIGLLRPTIVLPEHSPASWDQSKWQAILLHEAAHIARRDHWALLTQRVAILLFWWCPLAHLLGKRLNALRENICDDHALEGPCDQIGYAELLVESAERFLEIKTMPIPLALLDSARGGLEARVTRLLEKEKRPMIKLTWFGKAMAAGFLGLGCLLATAATAFSQPQTAPQKRVQIKIIVDGKEFDLSDAKLLEHFEAVQKKHTAAEAPKFKVTLGDAGQPVEAGVLELAFSPDGKPLTQGGGARVFIWDAKTDKLALETSQGPAQLDPRIEELVRAAEKIKPGSGADVRKALQSAAKKAELPPTYYYRAIQSQAPMPVTAVPWVGDKKIIILSIQDGKVQQLNEQELKKLWEKGQVHFRVFDVDATKAKSTAKPAPPIEFEFKAPITAPKSIERKVLTLPVPAPPAPDLEALQRQLERINAELSELRKRMEAGKK